MVIQQITGGKSRTFFRFIALSIFLAMLLAACGDEATSSPALDLTAPATTAPAPAQTTVAATTLPPATSTLAPKTTEAVTTVLTIRPTSAPVAGGVKSVPIGIPTFGDAAEIPLEPVITDQIKAQIPGGARLTIKFYLSNEKPAALATKYKNGLIMAGYQETIPLEAPVSDSKLKVRV